MVSGDLDLHTQLFEASRGFSPPPPPPGCSLSYWWHAALPLSLLVHVSPAFCVCPVTATTTIYNCSLRPLVSRCLFPTIHLFITLPLLAHARCLIFSLPFAVGIAQSVLPNRPHPSLSVSTADRRPSSLFLFSSSSRSLTSIPGFWKICAVMGSVQCAWISCRDV